jgi:hypothetical protein
VLDGFVDAAVLHLDSEGASDPPAASDKEIRLYPLRRRPSGSHRWDGRRNGVMFSPPQ